MLEYFYLFIVSLISNIFSAFSGGGAGVIQLPAILLIFDTTFINALAVHKTATVALGIGASLRFLRSVQFNKKLLLVSLSFGLPSVIMGAKLISHLNDGLSRLLLGFLIISLAIYSFKEKKYGEYEKRYVSSAQNNFLGIILIFFVGLLNGSLSAGTGLIFTIIMISWYGMDYKRAIAYTLVIVGFFYNATGAITLGLLTNIDWSILPPLLLGSLIGGYFGAHLALSKDNKTIKIIYQTITILVGASLIYN